MAVVSIKPQGALKIDAVSAGVVHQGIVLRQGTGYDLDLAEGRESPS